MAGVLYIVATPIGNLEDITLRAIRVLKEVAVIACEDTRVTKKLLGAHGIETKTVAYHAHSTDAAADAIINRLLAGEDVAVVSDAGTPLVSDPGEELVGKALAAGIAVVPIPGASALTSALCASGVSTHRVLFLGFLPRAEIEQREVLAPLRDAPYTIVLYESPNRVLETLRVLAKTLGDRPGCVAREVTKRFETFERGTLSALATQFEKETLGEIVIVVGPAEAAQPASNLDRAREEAQRLLAEGMKPADVARTIAGAHGLARQEAYKLVLDIKSQPSR